MFHPDAYIATLWSQGGIDDFIAGSKEAFAAQRDGIFYILHCVTGQTVEVQGDRAVSSMKVTIPSRVTADGGWDGQRGRPSVFLHAERQDGVWGVMLYKLLFDKDKWLWSIRLWAILSSLRARWRCFRSEWYFSTQCLFGVKMGVLMFLSLQWIQLPLLVRAEGWAAAETVFERPWPGARHLVR